MKDYLAYHYETIYKDYKNGVITIDIVDEGNQLYFEYLGFRKDYIRYNLKEALKDFIKTYEKNERSK